MATTKRNNLVSTDILAEAVQAEFRGMKALYGTRAAIIKTNMPTNGLEGDRLRQGDTIRIPYFDAMGEMQDIVVEGDALTPQLLTQSSETAVVKHSGIAFEITRFARQFGGGGGDPYAEAARQFKELGQRRMDRGLLDAASSGLDSAYIHDVYNASTPVYLDWDVLIDAKMKWGDEQSDIEMLVVDSTTYGRLMKQKDSTGRPLWVDIQNGTLPRFCGVPVKVSDRLTAENGRHKSRILKAGALVLWVNGEPSFGEDGDILADTDVLAMHVYWVAHRYNRTPGSTKPGVVEIVHN